jgi:S-formylglutathione hydrolase FrmB
MSAIARRRAVALLALAAVAVAIWLVAFRDGGIGSADRRGATVEEITIESAAVGESLPVSVVESDATGEDPPLLVFLHGRDGNEESGLVDEMFAALDGLGDRAPVVAFPYGGEASYWHDRDDGDWGRYVLEEVIPTVARESGADPGRVAIGGISMGGYGAYSLAAEAPGRFCAVGGHAPAIWQTAGETAEGAFDDAEDFAAHDVIAAVGTQPEAFTGQPLWIDSGNEDPFVPGDDALIVPSRPPGPASLLAAIPAGTNPTTGTPAGTTTWRSTPGRSNAASDRSRSLKAANTAGIGDRDGSGVGRTRSRSQKAAISAGNSDRDA